MILATSNGDWALFGIAVAWASGTFGFIAFIVGGFAVEWIKGRRLCSS